jgi:Ferredoxin-like domain in Api92-like protein
MPNHVRNMLTIIGPARDVATFVLRSQTPTPRTGDRPGSCNYDEPEDHPQSVPFDFHGVVPLPARYSAVPYSPTGYEMQVRTWSVKWGPYHVNPATDIHIGEHRATYTFTTAWCPPGRYYLAASAQFPQCTFYVSWGGEGPCVGRAIYRHGACVDADELDDNAFPGAPEDWDDDAAVDAYSTAYSAAERHYLDQHTHWVDGMIAKETR